METSTILRLLSNAGFYNLRVVDNQFIQMENPSCVLRGFENFLDYAWVILVFITGMMLFGWAVAMTRSHKNAELMSVAENLRNLLLIFGVLSLVRPVVNLIAGGDIFAKGCDTIQVSIEEVQKLIDTKKLKLNNAAEYDLYEDLRIYDSGVTSASAYDNVQ